MPAYADRGSANGATLWLKGNVINNGTIGLAVNQSSNPQQMNIVTAPTNTGTIANNGAFSSAGTFTNNGVINIPADQTTNFTSEPPPGAISAYVAATNNGTINVYGTLELANVDLLGNGTITIGDVPTISDFRPRWVSS